MHSLFCCQQDKHSAGYKYKLCNNHNYLGTVIFQKKPHIEFFPLTWKWAKEEMFFSGYYVNKS